MVEDDPVYARILRGHVGRLGDRVAEVVHVERVVDGLERHRAEPADLVLLDLTLPDSPPAETLRRVGDFVSGGAVVLVLSALDDPEAAADARAAGALEFVDKAKVSAERIERALDSAAAGAAAAPGEAAEHAAAPVPAPSPGPSPAPSPGPDSEPPSEPPSEPLPEPLSGPAAKDAPGHDDPRVLAAQLVHDAKSWLTNHSFRLAALKRSAGPELAGLVEGLSDTARALEELLDGGRGLVIDETTPVDAGPVELRAWLAGWTARRSSGPGAAAVPEIAAGPPLTVRASAAGLETVMSALIHNAEQASPGRPVTVAVRATAPAEGWVDLELDDDGGPWAATDSGGLTTAFQKGDRGSTRAGLGLYRARRWMERMGGSLELIPRADVPGAMSVRLRFQSE